MGASEILKIDIQSEIGRLDAVLLHRPGAEVENMTPRNVSRALYSDILNLSIAQKEYEQLYGVLSKVSKVYEVSGLLVRVLDREKPREELVRRICVAEDVIPYYETLMQMTSRELARVLIEGLPARIDTLTSYFRNEYYAIYPLYNFYFTRDAAVTVGDKALICRMANKVRMRESLIMNAIYRHSGAFECEVVDANEQRDRTSPVIMEGGDIIIAREDILIIGNGIRTTSQGIDFIVDRISRSYPHGRYNVLVQQLPSEPESFIHLDMAFTLLDKDKCMAFKPLIMQTGQYQTVHIIVDDGRVTGIRPVAGLLPALKGLGMDLKPLTCGGADDWDQEREQWHSGANFFAFAPGKVLTYARNVHTLEELDANGFEIISATDFVSGRRDDLITDPAKLCAVAINGSELPRGGGGARCMTMPLSRQKINW
ncbi:MAG: arginine deiminase [Bacteroidales bacterium]|nr:arginine deiminase [Bacteroidales bacterium]MBQ8812051.1 arginine deiminase [Bacteroidales bacterium]